jgi:hypothetical protein
MAAVVSVGLPLTTYAQGCAMCNANASAAKQAGIQALRNGIVILLIPPLLIFVGILWLASRRRPVEEFEGIHTEDERDREPSRLTAELPGELAGESVFPNGLNSNTI